MRPKLLGWVVFVFLLLVAQTVWADFVLLKFADNIQSRGMMLYFASWVILLAIPLLNRHIRVVVVYIFLFLLSRGFARITDEQDPIRALYSVLPGITLGLKLVWPLLAIAAIIKGIEWVLCSLGVFSKALTLEEMQEALNAAVKEGKSAEEFAAKLKKTGANPQAIKEGLRRYEKRRQAGNGFEETI